MEHFSAYDTPMHIPPIQHAYGHQYQDYGHLQHQDYSYGMDHYAAANTPYSNGIESYLDPKYASNPSAFAARLPYLPFQATCGTYDYNFEPAFIRKRNERERQRVKCVNEGYARLREHLPDEFSEKRLSKVETLRGAIQYINRLQKLLGFENDKNKSATEKNKPKEIKITECNEEARNSNKVSSNKKENVNKNCLKSNDNKSIDKKTYEKDDSFDMKCNFKNSCKVKEEKSQKTKIISSPNKHLWSNIPNQNSETKTSQLFRQSSNRDIVTSESGLLSSPTNEMSHNNNPRHLNSPLKPCNVKIHNYCDDILPKDDVRRHLAQSYFTKCQQIYEPSFTMSQTNSYIQDSYPIPHPQTQDSFYGNGEAMDYYCGSSSLSHINFNLDSTMYSNKYGRYNPYMRKENDNTYFIEKGLIHSSYSYKHENNRNVKSCNSPDFYSNYKESIQNTAMIKSPYNLNHCAQSDGFKSDSPTSGLSS